MGTVSDFYIVVKSGWKEYKLLVHQKMIDERNEQYAIIAKNKTVVLESNRPFFRNRGLKHRKPDWKIVEGKINNGSGLDQIIQKIMEKVDV